MWSRGVGGVVKGWKRGYLPCERAPLHIGISIGNPSMETIRESDLEQSAKELRTTSSSGAPELLLILFGDEGLLSSARLSQLSPATHWEDTLGGVRARAEREEWGSFVY